jgi:hypothetical protein
MLADTVSQPPAPVRLLNRTTRCSDGSSSLNLLALLTLSWNKWRRRRPSTSVVLDSNESDRELEEQETRFTGFTAAAYMDAMLAASKQRALVSPLLRPRLHQK